MAVNIDFPDEDIEQVSYDEFLAELMKQQERVRQTLNLLEFASCKRRDKN